MFNICSDCHIRPLKITGIIEYGKKKKTFDGVEHVEIPICLPITPDELSFPIDFESINDKIMSMMKNGRVLLACPTGHISNAQAISFLMRERKYELKLAICALMKLRMEVTKMPPILYQKLNEYCDELKLKHK